MQSSHQLISLLRQSLWGETVHMPKETDWEAVLREAEAHGVAAIIGNGVGKGIEVPKTMRLQWAGGVLAAENLQKKQEQTLKLLAEYYCEHGIKTMVLKGIGLGRNYPTPQHRPSGDVDIWCFGACKQADLLMKGRGVKIDNSHHTHTVFQLNGVTVENHYNFISTYQRFSNRKVEKRLQKLAREGYAEIEGVCYPSADFNALHVLRHCAGDFTSTRMSLRQVLDWGFLLKKHYNEIEWSRYLVFLREIGMMRFFNLMNVVCVKYLGFPAECFQQLEEDEMEELFVAAIIDPEIGEREDGSLWSGLTRKPLRWWKNRWKRRLCYNDNDVITFIYGLWGKMLKPTHFIH